MSLLLLIGVLNRFALVFALLNLLFALAGYRVGGVPAYLAVSAATWLTGALPRRLRPVLLLAPVPALAWIGAWPLDRTAFLLLATSYGTHLALRGQSTSHDAAVDDFNAGVLIALGLLGLAAASFSIGAFERAAAPFLLVYLISAVAFLRLARDTATGAQNSASGRLLSLGIVTAAALLCSGPVRSAILAGLRAGYHFLLRLIELFLGRLLLALGVVLARLIEILSAIGRRPKGIPMPPSEQSPLLEAILEAKGRGALGRIIDSGYLSAIGQALLLVLCAYLLLRLFRRRDGTPAEPAVGTEVRTGIPRSDRGANSRLSLPFRRPSDPTRAVRFYYGQFLLLCGKKAVEIRASDTSAEIHRKARAVFGEATLAGLRRIYLEVRYGGRPATEEEARTAGRCYRRLRGESGRKKE